MGEAAELSPIDPTTGNQFNPPLENDPKTRKGISVEDVTSYIELARDPQKVGLESPDHILEVFKRLSEEVHPIALGNVNRAHNQIRFLADKLLSLHLNGEEAKSRIKRIVDQLTRELYSHTHALNRKESREILGADLVTEAAGEEQRLLWRLYEEYAQTLKLRETLTQDSIVVSDTSSEDMEITGAFIETESRSFAFRSQCRITRVSEIPKGVQVQVPAGQPMPLVPGFPVRVDVNVLSLGWLENEKGD